MRPMPTGWRLPYATRTRINALLAGLLCLLAVAAQGQPVFGGGRGSGGVASTTFSADLKYPPTTFTTDFIDASTNSQLRVLSANTTLHTTNFVLGSYVQLEVKQDATGTRAITIDSTNTLRWKSSTNQVSAIGINTNGTISSWLYLYKSGPTTIDIGGPETAPHHNTELLNGIAIDSGFSGSGALAQTNAPVLRNVLVNNWLTVDGNSTNTALAMYEDGIDVALSSIFRSTLLVQDDVKSLGSVTAGNGLDVTNTATFRHNQEFISQTLAAHSQATNFALNFNSGVWEWNSNTNINFIHGTNGTLALPLSPTNKFSVVNIYASGVDVILTVPSTWNKLNFTSPFVVTNGAVARLAAQSNGTSQTNVTVAIKSTK